MSRLLNEHYAERVRALEQHAHRQQLDEDFPDALQIFVTSHRVTTHGVTTGARGPRTTGAPTATTAAPAAGAPVAALPEAPYRAPSQPQPLLVDVRVPPLVFAYDQRTLDTLLSFSDAMARMVPAEALVAAVLADPAPIDTPDTEPSAPDTAPDMAPPAGAAASMVATEEARPASSWASSSSGTPRLLHHRRSSSRDMLVEASPLPTPAELQSHSPRLPTPPPSTEATSDSDQGAEEPDAWADARHDAWADAADPNS